MFHMPYHLYISQIPNICALVVLILKYNSEMEKITVYLLYFKREEYSVHRPISVW